MIFRRTINVAIPLLLTLSLISNLVLARRLRSAQDALFWSGRLTFGEIVKPFKARLSDGTPILLGWQESPLTIIYYFDEDCVWCQRNKLSFEAMASQIGSRASIYRYTTRIDKVPAVDHAGSAHTRLITDELQDIKRLLKLGGTPQTLVLDSAGKLLKNWEGAFVGSNRDEIQDFLAVQLPAIDQRASLGRKD